MDLYEELKAKKIGGAASGGFTPTEQQLAAMNSGITLTDVAQINTNKNSITDIKDGTSINSFGDVEDALDDKADKSATYTKTEVDTALRAKANAADVYSKSDVETALAGKQDTISDLPTIRNGAAAGATAVQPATLETALAQKQDALSSEQLDAVNSGVTSADVEQITTNKKNISYNTNQGVKNLFNNIATASSGNRVSYTPNADKSGTITTESTGASAPVYFDLGSVTLPSGSYTLSGGVSAGVSLRDSNNIYIDEGNGVTITLSQLTSISLRIRVATGYTNTNGITVYPMIRNAIISDITYQPYAMSNVELTAAIQALQAQLANLANQ